MRTDWFNCLPTKCLYLTKVKEKICRKFPRCIIIFCLAMQCNHGWMQLANRAALLMILQLANHAFSVNDFLCYLLPLDKCYHGHEGQRAFSEHDDDDQEGWGDAGAGLGDDGDDADRREVDRARQHHQGGSARSAGRKVKQYITRNPRHFIC